MNTLAIINGKQPLVYSWSAQFCPRMNHLPLCKVARSTCGLSACSPAHLHADVKTNPKLTPH